MDADDFQDLYKLLRGSRCAVAVLDARTLFAERKMEDSLLKMTEARASFAESRHRVLRQDPEKTIDAKAKDRDHQVKKAKRKQEKAQETLDAFDEILPTLTKLAQRQVERRERQGDAGQTQPDNNPSSKSHGAATAVKKEASDSDDVGPDSYSDFDSISDGPLPQESQEVYSTGAGGPQRPVKKNDFPAGLIIEFAAGKGDAKLDLIGSHFGFRPVDNELDVVGDGVYLIQTSKRTILASLPVETCEADELRLFNLVEEKHIKPISRVAFLDLGVRRKMVLLTCPAASTRRPVDVSKDSNAGEMGGGIGSDPAERMVDHGTAMGDPGTVVEE